MLNIFKSNINKHLRKVFVFSFLTLSICHKIKIDLMSKAFDRSTAISPEIVSFFIFAV